MFSKASSRAGYLFWLLIFLPTHYGNILLFRVPQAIGKARKHSTTSLRSVTLDKEVSVNVHMQQLFYRVLFVRHLTKKSCHDKWQRRRLC
jgi:hypothetical protein